MKSFYRRAAETQSSESLVSFRKNAARFNLCKALCSISQMLAQVQSQKAAISRWVIGTPLRAWAWAMAMPKSILGFVRMAPVVRRFFGKYSFFSAPLRLGGSTKS